MKTRFSLFLILATILTGCTHSHIVRPSESKSYVSLNKRGLRQQATITLVKGRKLKGDKLRFAPDSTSWVDPHTQSVIAVPTAEVTHILFVRRGKGALEGLGLGFLTGALFGVPFALAGWIDIVLFLGPYVGALGGLIGLPVGIAVGSQEIYRIEHESP